MGVPIKKLLVIIDMVNGFINNSVQCYKEALNHMMQIGAKITKGEDNEQSQTD